MMKKILLSLFATVFLTGYMMELAPMTLAAQEAHATEMAFVEKIAETIVQDQTGKYRISSEKVNQYSLEYIHDKLQRLADELNATEVAKPQMESMMVIAIGIDVLLGALASAGMTGLVGIILAIGIFGACKAKALDMYRHWSRTNNWGSYLFYQFCMSRGWF